MASRADPLDFAAAFLRSSGAAVDASPGRLEAVLPEETCAELGLDEYSVLVTEPAEGDRVHAVGFGSTGLERLVEAAQGEGKACRLRLRAPAPHIRDLTELARKRFRFESKVRIRFLDTSVSSARYLWAHYGLSALSEDSFEGLVSVAINESTLAPVPDLDRELEALDLEEDTGSVAAVSKNALRAVRSEAMRLAKTRLGPFLGRQERRRARDRDRLHEYYDSLARETITRGKRGRKQTGTGEERLESIRTELARKVRELDLAYTPRVRLRLVTAARVTIQVLEGTYLFQWRRAERRLPVIWNPVLSDFEPVPCEGCGAGRRRLEVRETLTALCEACARKP